MMLGVLECACFFFFKQKTAYELRISDWSSDVCSSDLDPELLFEQSPERLGLGVNVLRSVPFSKGAGELAGGAAGGIDIALHLAQRDRALRQRPVRMEDGIVAVLPSLVGEAAVGHPAIFDEAVEIGRAHV